MEIRVHGFEPFSRANGPGFRSVIWLQGCSMGCPCCFNPGTHDPGGGHLSQTEDLINQIAACKHQIEGVSISGGEPFQQPEALLALLTSIQQMGLSALVFTGYDIEEIKNMPGREVILKYIDVLIAGRYIQSQRLGHSLLGSSNQKIHLLSSRYNIHDFERIPQQEIIIKPSGEIIMTGINTIFKAKK